MLFQKGHFVNQQIYFETKCTMLIHQTHLWKRAYIAQTKHFFCWKSKWKNRLSNSPFSIKVLGFNFKVNLFIHSWDILAICWRTDRETSKSNFISLTFKHVYMVRIKKLNIYICWEVPVILRLPTNYITAVDNEGKFLGYERVKSMIHIDYF